MQKKINTFLNIIMGSSVGVLLGHGLYVYWEYHKYPELYEMQSAPWYTSILLYGSVTIMLLTAAVLIKWLLRERKNSL